MPYQECDCPYHYDEHGCQGPGECPNEGTIKVQGCAPTALWIDGQQRCEHCAEPLGSESFDVHCDTCGRPLTECEDCWNDSDDCPECEEKREREVWCPLCDRPLVGMPSEEKQRHYDGHREKK